MVMGKLPKKIYSLVDALIKNENQPMIEISWDEAKEFIRRLNAKNDGYVYRLPSEAEWEYACLAGTTTAFSFGDNLNSNQGNFGKDYNEESTYTTAIVGSYQPNAWGLYDMHGNVSEYVEDVYANYDGLPNDGSANLKDTSNKRVTRGGNFSDKKATCRCATRASTDQDSFSAFEGFRIVAIPTS